MKKLNLNSKNALDVYDRFRNWDDLIEKTFPYQKKLSMEEYEEYKRTGIIPPILQPFHYFLVVHYPMVIEKYLLLMMEGYHQMMTMELKRDGDYYIEMVNQIHTLQKKCIEPLNRLKHFFGKDERSNELWKNALKRLIKNGGLITVWMRNILEIREIKYWNQYKEEEWDPIVYEWIDEYMQCLEKTDKKFMWDLLHTQKSHMGSKWYLDCIQKKQKKQDPIYMNV